MDQDKFINYFSSCSKLEREEIMSKVQELDCKRRKQIYEP